MKVLSILLLVVTTAAAQGSLQNLQQLVDFAKLKNVSLDDFELSPRKILETIGQSLNGSADNFEDSIVVPMDCINHLLLMVSGIQNGELWAIAVVDAWSKIQSGFLMGNILNMGHFNECLMINRPIETLNISNFVGRHCVLQLGGIPDREIPEGETPGIGDALAELGLGVDFSICIPTTCPPIIFTTLLENAFLVLGINLRPTEARAAVQETYCHAVTDESPTTALDIGALIWILLIAAFVFLSTTYDLIVLQLKKTPNQLLNSFSMYTNGRKLFSLKKKPGDIRCLHGIRSLSVIWLMLGHRYFVQLLVFPFNVVEFLTIFMEGFFSLFVFSSQLGIDTLLLLAGVTLAYNFMRRMDRKGHFSISRMYLHHYLRVMPILMFSVLIFLGGGGPGDGPYHTFLKTNQIPQCEEYWWSAMLFVQNYVNPSRVCLLHSWWLSVEMQLIWLSPILLFPLYFWGRKFSWFVFLNVFLSIGCVLAVSIWNDFWAFLPFNAIPDVNKLIDFVRLVFMPTHTRMGPFLIGIFTGYILGRMKDKKLVMNRILETIIWAIALTIPFTVIFLSYPFQRVLDNETTFLQNAFYLAFSRNLFALSVAWIIFGCHNGSGSFVNWLLSRPIWQPLSRIALVFYLTNIGIQIELVASLKTPSYFGNMELLHQVNGDFLVGLIVASIAYLAVQAPILRVEKYLFSLGRKKDSRVEGEITFDNMKWYQRFI